MDYVIETEDLTKVYKKSKGKKALDSVSIRVPKGGIFCLLGRNGAGKTTLLRIVGTQLLPTEGGAEVLGFDVMKEADKIRPRIAVVPQEARVWNFSTPWDYVYFYARLRGTARDLAARSCSEALKKLDLYDVRNDLCMRLSGGMRQRILVCMALVSDADLLLLDEPSIGLDPISRRQLWSYIRALSATGHTILLTTHYMEEAEALADNVAIVHDGKLVINSSLSQILEVGSSGMVLEVTGSDLAWVKDYRGAEPQNGKTTIELAESDEDSLGGILRKSRETGSRVVFRRKTLEDVFIGLVGGEENGSA